MADSATKPVTGETVPPKAAPKSPKKKATLGAAKNKKSADHPNYSEMIQKALTSLKERDGSSRKAILKYIVKNFKVGNDEHVVNQHLKMVLRPESRKRASINPKAST